MARVHPELHHRQSGSPATAEADAVVVGVLARRRGRAAAPRPGRRRRSTQLSTASWPPAARRGCERARPTRSSRCRRAGTITRAAAGGGRPRQAPGRRRRPPSRSAARPGPPHARWPAPATRSARSGGSTSPPRPRARLLGAYTFTATTAPTARPRPPVARVGLRHRRRRRRQPCCAPATAVGDRRAHRPRPGQHPAQRPLPGVVRRPRAGAGRGGGTRRSRCSTTRRWPRRASAGCSASARVRRASRGWCGCSWPGGTVPAREGRAGRQGDHVRHRRHLDQARGRTWTT